MKERKVKMENCTWVENIKWYKRLHRFLFSSFIVLFQPPLYSCAKLSNRYIFFLGFTEFVIVPNYVLLWLSIDHFRIWQEMFIIEYSIGDLKVFIGEQRLFSRDRPS